MSPTVNDLPTRQSPPPGVLHNVTDLKSLVPATAIVIAITTAIMTLFVLLRLYCRVWVTKSVAGDDSEPSLSRTWVG